MALYVEVPADEYGNTYRTPAIIDAEPVEGNPRSLRVRSPLRYAVKWPTVPAENYRQIDGPGSMMLSREQWEALVGFQRQRPS